MDIVQDVCMVLCHILQNSACMDHRIDMVHEERRNANLWFVLRQLSEHGLLIVTT